MTIELSTPALLFPTVSLLFLSYTSRFLALSSLIRKLHAECTCDDSLQSKKTRAQIKNLRGRLRHIKHMQEAGAVSLLFCVISMCSILADLPSVANITFVIALALMALSLIALVREVMQSGGALNILLDEAEDGGN